MPFTSCYGEGHKTVCTKNAHKARKNEINISKYSTGTKSKKSLSLYKTRTNDFHLDPNIIFLIEPYFPFFYTYLSLFRHKMFRSCVSCAENIIKKLSEFAESEFGIDPVL